MRPIEIARRLNISTTTLRKYEELHLIPAVERSAAGYRLYTKEHLAYFICIRELLHGFTLKQIGELLGAVMQGSFEKAFWLVNDLQARLKRDRIISERIVQRLFNKSSLKGSKESKIFTIHDVSRETGVPATTIRYWDRVGLIASKRCRENNYRIFSQEDIQQVLVIYALKLSLSANRQKHSIERMRGELKDFNYEDNRLVKMTRDIDAYLNEINRAQIRGISALYNLCTQVEGNEFHDAFSH